jgi:hypothetical protein
VSDDERERIKAACLARCADLIAKGGQFKWGRLPRVREDVPVIVMPGGMAYFADPDRDAADGSRRPAVVGSR